MARQYIGLVVVLSGLTGCGAAPGPTGRSLVRADLAVDLIAAMGAKQGDVEPGPTARTGRVNVPRAPADPVPPPADPAPALLPSEHFELAEDARSAFERRHIVGRDAVHAIQQLRAAFTEARRINDHYMAALDRAQVRWTVASLAGAGETWLALTAQIRTMTVAASGGVSADEWAEATQRAVGPWAHAAECLGVGRLALASRAARAASLADDRVQRVDELLAGYTEADLRECIDVVRLGDADHGIPADPTFAPYVRGEFDRAPMGATAALPPGSMRPPLEVAE